MERVGRPAGVALMASLQVLIGAAFLLNGIGSLTLVTGGGEVAATLEEAPSWLTDNYRPGLLLIGVSLLALAAIAFALAYGLVRRREWSWTLGMTAAVVDILGIMVQPLFSLDPETLLSTAIALSVPVILAFYLTRFPVRAYFGKV